VYEIADNADTRQSEAVVSRVRESTRLSYVSYGQRLLAQDKGRVQ